MTDVLIGSGERCAGYRAAREYERVDASHQHRSEESADEVTAKAHGIDRAVERVVAQQTLTDRRQRETVPQTRNAEATFPL